MQSPIAQYALAQGKLGNFRPGSKDVFDEWFSAMKDRAARAAILKRLDRVKLGNFGDHEPVGGGVSELRIDFAPGYRVYYGEDGPIVVVILCGRDKSTQTRDIRRAKELWALYRRGQ